MTEKMPFFDNLSVLEEQLVATLTQVNDIKSNYQKIMAENTRLNLENARLRDRLSEVSEHVTENKNEKSSKKVPMSNLLKIYEDGFHVCHDFYGQRLEAGETCQFCDGVLYR
ncbi:initiation-control protein YabA [Lactococcus hodotermopsidis]|uniref:Initiation-control protein YabA n=1 Tax=Pseudolactococcus hodotermopsidis TaxID=2709157 RepID=A0A6A0BD87_9LACT|nr:initiation control protein YabA [Lactococcus hodotermopsidis]GFH42625.1 initiation-control protein YabA [Lactococcus hodotermopsidis]